jgi:hypothetical protein
VLAFRGDIFFDFQFVFLSEVVILHRRFVHPRVAQFAEVAHRGLPWFRHAAARAYVCVFVLCGVKKLKLMGVLSEYYVHCN